jgi:ATP-binding cassette, subfamily B, bacterial MsbA
MKQPSPDDKSINIDAEIEAEIGAEIDAKDSHNLKSSKQTYKRLFSYIKEVKLAFIVAIIGNLIYALMDVTFIALIEPLMDEGLVKGQIDFMKMAPVVILGIMFVRGIAAVISTYCMASVGQRIVQRLRQQLIECYLKLPTTYFDKNSSGNLISKVTFNTQQVASASSDAITKMFREGGAIIFAISYLFYTNWRLAAIFFISAPVIGYVVSITSKRFKKVSENIQNAMGGVTQTTQEIVDGYKVVKTFDGEAFETERFAQVVNTNRQQNMKLFLTKAISVPLIQLIAAGAMAIVIYFAAFELEANQLSPGEFAGMIFMIMFLLKPLKVISNLNSVLQQGIAAAEDIFKVIDTKQEVDHGHLPFPQSFSSIQLQNLNFRYGKEQPLVLQDISLTINRGETVAFVGRSGSGKSTLTNLLLRFYQAETGQININDCPIEDYSLASLRSNIAYVSQEVTLFNDSVAANIAYAEISIDQAKLVEAATKAHAIEFIENLPLQFNSLIGENGSQLSGGQRQRLAIARAIYKDAPIIILDEATSALDTESERHIQDAFDALTENRTTLVIAHRLSTIENADRIVVMDNGQIVEQGSHKELLALNNHYARLHTLQFTEQ